MGWRTETRAEREARFAAEVPGPDGRVELSVPPAPPGWRWSHEGGGLFRLRDADGDTWPPAAAAADDGE